MYFRQQMLLTDFDFSSKDYTIFFEVENFKCSQRTYEDVLSCMWYALKTPGGATSTKTRKNVLSQEVT